MGFYVYHRHAQTEQTKTISFQPQLFCLNIHRTYFYHLYVWKLGHVRPIQFSTKIFPIHSSVGETNV